ncbi:MAG: hypothetical protein J1E98_12315 [Lachnospiraceae bacterium]|nr:hypothetical protein [Lachnospiraceae bacterium]
MELKYYLRGLGLGIAITAVIMGIFSSKNKTMTNEEIIARAKQLGMTEDTVLSDIHSDKEDDNQDANDNADNSGEDRKVGQTGADDNAETDVQTDADTKQDDIAETGSNKVQSDTLDGDSKGSSVLSNSKDDIPDIDSSEHVEANAPSNGTRTTDTGTDAEAGEPDTRIPNNKLPDTETSDTGVPNVDTSTQTAETAKKPVVITIGRGDGSYTVSKKLADLGAVSSAGEYDTFLCENGYDKRIRTGTYTIPAGASDEQMARIITGME